VLGNAPVSQALLGNPQSAKQSFADNCITKLELGNENKSSAWHDAEREAELRKQLHYQAGAW